MPKLAANISMMFPELPILERFQAAYDAGFDAIELLHPFAHSVDELRERLERSQTQLILINAAMGMVGSNDRGIAGVEGREDEFHQVMDEAYKYAKELGISNIHVMAGVVPSKQDQIRYESTLIENLKRSAAIAGRYNITLLLEPLNSQDVPNYLHSRSDETLRLIRAIGCENVKLQYDFYHMQIMEGNLGQRVREHLDHIGHIQFSSVPGRHEPQFGEVNIDYLLSTLDALGYEGYVGCEYRPKGATLDGLTWARRWGIHPRTSNK